MEMTLAEEYFGRYGGGFNAYMALQRVLLERYLSCGGTKERWCERIAPVFRRRYAAMFELTSRD